MKLNIFNRKQKCAPTHFTPNLLPQNRKQHFADVFKNRFGTLLCLSALMLLFFAPAIAGLVYTDLMLVTASETYTGEELITATNTITYVGAAIILVALMVFSIGLAGVMKVYKRLIWSEPIFFWQDFRSGIKENIGQYLLIAFIIGLFNFSATFFSTLLGNTHIGMYFIYGLNFALIYPICFNCLFLNAVYKNHFIITLKVAFKFYAYEFLLVIAMCVVFYALLFLKMINIVLIKYIVIAVAIVLIIPIYLLGCWEIVINLFDKRINVSYYPDIYRKGLYIPKTDKNEN